MTAPTVPGRLAAGQPDAAGMPRRAWVEQIMGMPISIHVRGADAHGERAQAAVTAAFGLLRGVDVTFSTYRPDSQVSRLQRGELDLSDCSAEVREVHRLCLTALERTRGSFDAWRWSRPGERHFDPTGLVKGWAIGRAGALLGRIGDLDWAIDAGGDVLVHTAQGPGWQVGIEDPCDRTQVLATIDLRDAAIATSGTAARGTHIVDPSTGVPAAAVLSATVIGPSILWADVFATAAVVRGHRAVEWAEELHGTSGMLVLDDGTVHRWATAD